MHTLELVPNSKQIIAAISIYPNKSAWRILDSSNGLNTKVTKKDTAGCNERVANDL